MSFLSCKAEEVDTFTDGTEEESDVLWKKSMGAFNDCLLLLPTSPSGRKTAGDVVIGFDVGVVNDGADAGLEGDERRGRMVRFEGDNMTLGREVSADLGRDAGWPSERIVVVEKVAGVAEE